MDISCRLNGEQVAFAAKPHELMVEVLRERLGLHSVKLACGTQVCGACTVLLDGRPVSACCTLASEMDGADVQTVESLGSAERLHPLQQAFIAEAAMQCGYCTSGMLLTAVALLREHPRPTREEIQHWLHGNVCRCGGYAGIVTAVERAAKQLAGGGDTDDSGA